MTATRIYTFSAVVPCYNAGEQLRITLDSLLSQTVPLEEIIVVDDGSTDHSLSIANSYGGKVKVIHQINQGAAVARFTGVQNAHSDFIVFADAGDLSLPNRVELFQSALTLDPSAIAVTAEVCAPTKDGTIGAHIAPVRFTQPLTVLHSPLDYYTASTTPLALAMNMAIKRSVAEKSCNVSNFYKASNDFVLQAQTAQHGWFVHVSTCTVTYEPTPNGITAKYGIRRQIAYALLATIKINEGAIPSQRKTALINRLSHEWIDATWQMLKHGEYKAAATIAKACLTIMPLSAVARSVVWTYHAAKTDSLSKR